MNLLEMVNSFENLWIWFELGCFWNFWLIQFWFQFDVNQKSEKCFGKSIKYDWNNTCGWAVRKKKSNKFRFKFNSNQFEKCRKEWMCLKFWLKRVKTCWKKLYLGLKKDAEWSKMVWNRSNLLTISDFRFHLKDRWNLTKNQVNSFENLWIWFEIVQNFKFDFKNGYESDDRVWRSKKKKTLTWFMISG